MTHLSPELTELIHRTRRWETYKEQRNPFLTGFAWGFALFGCAAFFYALFTH